MYKIDLDDAFINRPTTGTTTENLLRIASVYRLWKKTQAECPSHYQVSREWLPIYNQYMGDIKATLYNNDLIRLKFLYENFFRVPLSTGLHGLHFNMYDKYMAPNIIIANDDLKIYLESCVHSAYNFLKSCPSDSLDVLTRPPIGNPYSYNINGKTIFPCAEYHYSFSQRIRILTSKIDNPTVLELGGGFGGLAYYLLRDSGKKIKYIAIDLPENCALQAFYLMSHFPDLNIKLYGEDDSNATDDYDVLIMPNFAIGDLAEDTIDLTFNSYSLSEMSQESIDNYLALICKITKEYIYHLNHVYWEINADNFAIDLNKFQLLFRAPTVWGKDPSNYKLDQHEFLYTRR